MSRITHSAVVALSLCCLALGAHAANTTKIANEGSIGGEWKLADGITQLPVPGYPAEMKERGDSVCIAMGYAIDKTGKTGDFTVLKQWSSAGTEVAKDYFKPFSVASAGALSQWAFQPRPEIQNPQRTITVATMTFRGKDGMDGATLAGNCRIENLEAALREAGSKADRDLVRREMERATRAGNANNSMIANPGQNPAPTGRR
ncbi:hypothetical protein LF41_720 [Lysobacter dokdonensis DS-58]|uniref:TonB family protein n=1 Tax=Lysobacter dokdonensis DS-58 TaxID=1300345 RepID=A0A0A2WJI5_9GAMM|nr:hypothetical protein [Lysobacter dokdonensis]KGQ18425.1 hypothetical protein LF41_720 [Lysobacter dokdonensis DS-58]